VVTQEVKQRDELLRRVRQLDERARQEESYWVEKGHRAHIERTKKALEEERQAQEQDFTRFVPARLYYQQNQEKLFNELYPSRATEAEWEEIIKNVKDQPQVHPEGPKR